MALIRGPAGSAGPSVRPWLRQLDRVLNVGGHHEDQLIPEVEQRPYWDLEPWSHATEQAAAADSELRSRQETVASELPRYLGSDGEHRRV